MSLGSGPALEEGEAEEELEAHYDAPAHHPSPPPGELFEISTTVDPSYIISLIRKLLPSDARKSENASLGSASNACVQRSSTDCLEGSGGPPSRDEERYSSDDKFESMDIVDDMYNFTRQEGEYEDSTQKSDQPQVAAGEEVWEDCGCILWDLAANKTHAELMVQNLVLDVLLANLIVSQSVRITEICLGIIGNLACHEVLMKQIVSTNGLIEAVVDQLFSDDTQCLCEACRLLTLGLQSPECIMWAKGLQPEHTLARILWVAENTLNPQLIEKSIGLLLAILESQNEVASILLPPLMKLGVPSLLVNLLAFEMSKMISEKIPERYSALDMILRAIEALSVLDDYSQEISSNKELFHLVCELIKLPEKAEVANSCITASVLIANMLSDATDLAFEISQDSYFLQGFFDIFAFTSEDLEARSALWSIIARILVRVKETKISPSSLHQFVSVLVTKSDLIEDDLIDNQLDDLQEGATNGTRLIARSTALRRIISILNHWTSSQDCVKLYNDNEEREAIAKLLECCERYTR